MHSFTCDVCGQSVYFENSRCMSCGSALGYARAERQIRAIPQGSPEGGPRCVNLKLNGCNWIPDAAGQECFACSLTRTRPADADVEGLPLYYKAEQAKRRLVYELDGLGLPLEPRDDEAGAGLAFDLLTDANGPVTTGHADGVITIDLAEGDDVHREQVRVDLHEPYRTMLGHFRHEIGHYYWQLLVDGSEHLERSRELFGDDTASYADALDRHYHQGPPDDWQQHYVSAYATMHPWEDFAETFAHVLHIRETLETAHAFGLIVNPYIDVRRFSDVIAGTWLPLTYALNQIERSMGEDDLYPFVLVREVVEKLEFVNGLVSADA